MEEEVLGKAYDSRLMRRLFTYIRPYRAVVVVSLLLLLVVVVAAIVGIVPRWHHRQVLQSETRALAVPTVSIVVPGSSVATVALTLPVSTNIVRAA